jgi:hypothetical protein
MSSEDLLELEEMSQTGPICVKGLCALEMLPLFIGLDRMWIISFNEWGSRY